MPFTETFSLGTVKQSPAPQHPSPAALRNPPRLIQESCADASEPIANNVPTKPTSAIDRSVMAVPLRSNAALTSRFLERHTGSRSTPYRFASYTLGHRAGAAAAAANDARELQTRLCVCRIPANFIAAREGGSSCRDRPRGRLLDH